MTPQLTAAIARLKEKGDTFGKALAEEQTLERQRPLLKEMAIRRIMERDKCSATAAKDIANSDLEYMDHKVAQGESVVAHYRAEAEYEAAKAEACQAALITPDVLLLEAENERMSAQIIELTKDVEDVVDSNRALIAQRNAAQQERNDLRRTVEDANDMMAKAHGANADLVQANRDLAGQLATANEMLGKVRHELTTVHGLQATDKPDTFLEAPKGAARAVAETSWTLDVKSLIKEIDALPGVPVGGA